MNEKIGDHHGQRKKHRAVQKKEDTEPGILDFVWPHNDRQRHGYWREGRIAQRDFSGDKTVSVAVSLSLKAILDFRKPFVSQHMVRGMGETRRISINSD